MSAVSQACATCEDPARARCARRRVLDAGRPLPEGGARERRADARARAGADYGTRKLLGPLDLEREKEFYADDVVALVAKLFGPEIAGGSLAQADDSRVAEIAAEIRRRYEANLPEEPPPADQAAWQRAVPVYDELSELRKTLLTASRDALKDAVSSVAE